MRKMIEHTTWAAKALTMVWLGTPVIAAALCPLVFPVVIVGGVAYLATHRGV
jgi:hypothetical protein